MLQSGLGDLLLVGAVLTTALGFTLTILSLATRRFGLARIAAAGTGAVVVLYAVSLIGVALASRERVLPPGEEKSIEGFDPHLHFRVAGPVARQPDGALLVTLQLRSDALRAIQDPRTFRAALFDARGRRYTPEWSSAGVPGADDRFPPFARRLAPGTAYEATLRFRPDPDATGLRLLVDDLVEPGFVTIGSEASLFHKKTFFALQGV